jgi:hypothetical protein
MVDLLVVIVSFDEPFSGLTQRGEAVVGVETGPHE